MMNSSSAKAQSTSIEQQSTEQKAILVLGMHRSGTSALTRMLNLLGAELSENLLPPAADNPTGFWESQDLFVLHQEFLQQLDLDWDSIGMLDADCLRAAPALALIEQIKNYIRQEFAQTPLFVIKDPRICRLAPLWYRALAELNIAVRIIIQFRHPLEVARSLRRRNDFILAKSTLLWLQHVLEAEYYSRKQLRVVCEYSQLLSDWQGTSEHIATGLELAWPRSNNRTKLAIERFLTEDLRHTQSDLATLLKRNDIAQWVKQAYQLLLDLIDEPYQPDILAAFDQLRSELNSADQTFGMMLADHQQLLQQAQQNIVTLSNDLAARDTELQQTQTSLEVQQQKLDELGAQTETLQQELATTQHHLTTYQAAHDQLQQQIEHITAERETLRQTLEKSQVEQEELQQVLQQTQTEREELQQQLLHAQKLQNEQLKHTRQALSAAQQESQQYRSMTQALLASRSWRWMAPLRAVDTITKRVTAWPWVAGRYLGLSRQYYLLKRSDLFDENYYVQKYHDVAEGKIAPLWHFLLYGAAEGRNPNPFFDVVWYIRQYPDVAKSRLNPLSHYLLYGVKEGRNPHPAFNTLWYLQHYPDVAERQQNPLSHYLVHGRQEDRSTHPLAVELPAATTRSYATWFECYGVPDRCTLTKLALTQQPLISLIAWISEADRWEVIQPALQAISGQHYSRWQLYLLLSQQASAELQRLVIEYQTTKPDYIIVNKVPETQLWVSCQQHLINAEGALVACLNLHQLLSPLALYRIVQGLNRFPQARLLYGDEDCIDAQGQHHSPWFKTDWSPDTALSMDMLGSLVFYHRTIITRTGGFDHTLTIAQNYDLALRAAEYAKPEHIIHVPYILQHHHDTLPVSDIAPAIQKALQRRQQAAHVETSTLVKGAVRVRYHVPQPLPQVSVIIPTRDRLDLLQTCLRSLTEQTRYPNYEVIIVDNGSTEPETLAFFASIEQQFPQTRIQIIHQPGSFNYSQLNNKAVPYAHGTLLCLMNNDIEIIDGDWMEEMVSHACREQVGAVGALLEYPDGEMQHAGTVLGLGGAAAHIPASAYDDSLQHPALQAVIRNCLAVTGACLMVSKERYLAVGGMDETQLKIDFNDVDLCLKLAAKGYYTVWTPYARLIHHESKSRASHTVSPEQTRRFWQEASWLKSRWLAAVLHDPFYNPNLSTQLPGFQLAWPPRLKDSGWLEPGSAQPSLQHYASVTNLERIVEIQQAMGQENFALSRLERPEGLSIVILTLDKPEFILPLLEALQAAHTVFSEQSLGFEIIVGDTGSTDPQVLAAYENLPDWITVVRHMSYHFSKCNNQLFEQQVRFASTLFLNNDIAFDEAPQLLIKLYQALNQYEIIGAQLLFPDGTIQHAGIDVFREGELSGFVYHPNVHQQPPPADDSIQPALAVTGACLLIKSALFAQLGGFDPGYRTECQDAALCFSARRAGYRVGWLNTCGMTHFENGTRPPGSEDWPDRQRFMRHFAAYTQAELNL